MSLSLAHPVILRVVGFLKVKYHNFQQIAEEIGIQSRKTNPFTQWYIKPTCRLWSHRVFHRKEQFRSIKYN